MSHTTDVPLLPFFCVVKCSFWLFSCLGCYILFFHGYLPFEYCKHRMSINLINAFNDERGVFLHTHTHKKEAIYPILTARVVKIESDLLDNQTL